MTNAAPATRPSAAVAVTAIALAVDMFLYGSLVPLLPVLPAVQGSPLASALLFASYAVALLGGTPLVGWWIDRSGPRGPMLAGLVGLAVATVLFAVVVETPGTLGLVVLMLARAAQGLAAAASWTAGFALIAATHAPEQRGKVMGLALSAVGVGVLLGPFVAGALSEAFGLHAPFLVIAVLAAADAVARALLIKPDGDRQAGTAEAGYRALLAGPRAGLLITLTVIGASAIAFGEPILPLHLDELGMGTFAIGVVFAGAALAGAVVPPFAGALVDRIGATRVAAIGTVLLTIGFVLAGQASVPVSITGLLVASIGAQAVLAPTLVLIGHLAEHVRPPAYGAAYALYNLAYTAGLAVAPLLAGAGAALLGTTITLVAVGGLAAVTTAVLLVGRSR